MPATRVHHPGAVLPEIPEDLSSHTPEIFYDVPQLVGYSHHGIYTASIAGTSGANIEIA